MNAHINKFSEPSPNNQCDAHRTPQQKIQKVQFQTVAGIACAKAAEGRRSPRRYRVSASTP